MSKIVDIITSSFAKQAITPVTELLKAVLELFKDNKGKYSSKRTIEYLQWFRGFCSFI